LVCLEIFKGAEIRVSLLCRHRYHQACLDNWYANGGQGCAVCRNGGQPSLEDLEVPHDEAFRPEEEEKKASEAPIRRLTRTEEMKIR